MRSWLFVVFVFALALRVGYLQGVPFPLETRQTPIAYDAHAFFQSGVSLFEWSTGYRGANSRGTQNLLAVRGPVYPLFIALTLWVLPDSPWSVRYVQAVLGALCCAVIALLGCELANRRVGLIAGFLCAVYPTFILFTGRILSETLGIFLLSLGLLALARGLRRGVLAWMVASGFVIALAALARAPLLSVVPPLVIAATLGSKGAPLQKRGSMVAAFLCAALVPLFLWNAISSSSDSAPIAGPSGVKFIASVASKASHPDSRGWRTDDRMSTGGQSRDVQSARLGWDEIIEDVPWYPIAAASNLVFHQLWFPDNAWGEAPSWVHWFHRLLVVFAFAGLGRCLLHWRKFLPVLAVLSAMAGALIGWIEPRHNLPFMPVVFLLAGLFIAESLEAPPVNRKRILIGLAGIALTVVVLSGTRLASLARLFPECDPVALGVAGDAVRVGLIASWSVALWYSARETLGNLKALVAAVVPALLFALLFGSYAYIGSGPRWRSWHVVLDSQTEVVQTIGLPAPFEPERVTSIVWLVDLQSAEHPRELRVGINGNALSPDAYSWHRSFCSQRRDRSRQTVPPTCQPYQVQSRFSGALPRSPQWWEVKMDPESLGTNSEVSFSLTRDSLEVATAEPIRLGCAISEERAAAFFGPHPGARTPGAQTSVWRWLVLDDWRIWTTTALTSNWTKSRLLLHSRDFAPGPKPAALSSMFGRDLAHFNIRLVVDYEDGRRRIY